MIQQYITKKRMVLLAVCLSILGVLWALFQLYGTGRLVVNLPTEELPFGGQYSVSIYSSQDGQIYGEKLVGLGAVSRSLPSGSYEVEFKGDNRVQESHYITIKHFLGTTTLNPELLNQSNRTKLARGVESCAVSTNNIVYSYNCFGGQTLYVSNVSPAAKYSEKSPVPFVQGVLIDIAPYKEGVLVVHTQQTGIEAYDGDYLLSYAVGTSLVKQITIPKDFTTRNLKQQLKIVADRSGSDSFVISKADNSGVLKYSSIDAIPSQRFFEDLPEFASGTYVSRSLFGDRLVLAFGTPPETDQVNLKTKKEEKTVLRFYEDGLQSQEYKEFTLKTFLEKVELCSQNKVCLLDGYNLKVYQFGTKDLLKTFFNVQDMGVIPGTGLVYTKENKLFFSDLNNDLSRMIYESSNFKPSSFSVAQNGVTLNTFFVNDLNSSRLHTFFVGVEPAEKNQFPDDNLPLSRTLNSSVLDSDYVGTNMVLTITLDSALYNEQTNTVTYDQSEFQSKTQNILTDLKDRGLPENFTVEYIPSY